MAYKKVEFGCSKVQHDVILKKWLNLKDMVPWKGNKHLLQ